MSKFFKMLAVISFAVAANSSQAQTTELQIFDAAYHYAKKCTDNGKTAYFQGNHGYVVANLQEFSYTRKYMLTIASLSGYSEKQLEAELAKSRPALTKQLVAAGHLLCQ